MGTYWTDWIASSGIVGHNTGLRPTFIRGETKSFIDVTISTQNIASKLMHWEVLEDEIIRGETKSFIDVTISTQNIASKLMHWEVLEDEMLTEHQYIYFEIGKAGTGKRTVFTKPAVDWKAFLH
ncbi:hypothetical protein QE152_g15957 [Popillia japonica]|uniref:Uncharacterized protein n=1 Tax=Popillia japonica TaxID=7064 RepID=A0AAW1L6A4_POPJA